MGRSRTGWCGTRARGLRSRVLLHPPLWVGALFCALVFFGAQRLLDISAQLTPTALGSPRAEIFRMKNLVHIDTVRRLAVRAIDGGASRTSLISYDWDISGKCERPVPRSVAGRPYPRERWLMPKTVFEEIPFDDCRTEFVDGSAVNRRVVDVRPGHETPVYVDLTVRCRKCPACLRQRAREWAARAAAEFADATAAGCRNWFGTLTLRPAVQEAARLEACVRLGRRGVDFDTLTSDDQFKARVASLAPRVTRYLKRVRKGLRTKGELPVRFRYLWVAEVHLGGGAAHGLPHFHALIHECDSERPLRYRRLSREWQDGFCEIKLAEDVGSATYLTKYLAKAVAARVRASTRYGSSNKLTTPEGGNLTLPPRLSHGGVF